MDPDLLEDPPVRAVLILEEVTEQLEKRPICVRVPRSDGSVMEGGFIHRIDSPMIVLRWMERGLTKTKAVHLVLFWLVNQEDWEYKNIKFVEIDPNASDEEKKIACTGSKDINEVNDEKELLCTELFYVESCSTRITHVGSHWFAINPKTQKLRMVYVPEFCKLVHEGKIDSSVVDRYRTKKIKNKDVYDHDEIEKSKTLEEHLEESIRL